MIYRIVILLICFLFAGAAFAQYPATGNKSRLGWQTTADGLIWRGSLADTTSIKPTGLNNAYFILDTVNAVLYRYIKTNGGWQEVGGGLTMPFDSVTFVTSYEGVADSGELIWNNQSGTLHLGMAGNIEMPLGQGEAHMVRNVTGSSIAKGKVVYISGATGQRPQVSLANAKGEVGSSVTFGVTAEEIANNDTGFVFTSGYIHGINTSSLTEGEPLWLDTVPGGFTNIKRYAPIHAVLVGYVVTKKNNGTIFVKIQNGYELDELHNVNVQGVTDRGSLYYNAAQQIWRDTAPALLGTDTVSLSNRINLKLNISDTSSFARDNQIQGTAGQVAYFNTSSSVVSDTALRWSAANKSLGINMTATPSGANIIVKNSREPTRSTVVANQTFTGADTSNWTRGTGWTFNNVAAVATAATGNLTYSGALTIVPGNAYEITYTLSNYSSGTLSLFVGTASDNIPSHNATNSVIVISTGSATGGFRFTASNFTGNLDNISVVEIANPAPSLIAGQDDNSASLYSRIVMPNSTSLGIGSGTIGFYTTAIRNLFIGDNAGISNTIGAGNIFIGASAGEKNSAGGSNLFFGNLAGQANLIGSSNVFIGTNSGLKNTIGGSNLFFGASAGRENLIGNSNIFIGNNAGRNNISGGSNIFIGTNAGISNNSSSNNILLGADAGFQNKTGDENIFLGRSAGYATVSGANIFLGSFTGYSNTDSLRGSINIAIGYNSARNLSGTAASNVLLGNQINLPSGTTSNQLVISNLIFGTGASATGTTIPAGGRVGIKTNAPNRDFEVAGEVRITDLATDAPTRIVGADADGDLAQMTAGVGISFPVGASTIVVDTATIAAKSWVNGRFVQIADTTAMLSPYLRKLDTLSLSNRINGKLDSLAGEVTTFTIQDTAVTTAKIATGAVTGVKLGSITSSQLQTALSDETGTGAAVFATSPVMSSVKVDGAGLFGGSLNLNYTGAGFSTGILSFSARDTAKWTLTTNITNNNINFYNAASVTYPFTIKASNDYVGISTFDPQRTLHVTGEVRISDLSTDTPTRIVGADADGDLDDIKIGKGLELSNDTLRVISQAPVTVTDATYTVADGVKHIICTRNDSITITLPNAADWIGREITIKQWKGYQIKSASSNVVPFASETAGDTIIASAETNGSWVLLVSNGTNWIIMQRTKF